MSTITAKRETRRGRVTADTIRRAAIEQWGVAAASVVRYSERQTRIHFASGEPAIEGGGVWYALSVKRRAGGEWELIARRRTLAELLTLVAT